MEFEFDFSHKKNVVKQRQIHQHKDSKTHVNLK